MKNKQTSLVSLRHELRDDDAAVCEKKEPKHLLSVKNVCAAHVGYMDELRVLQVHEHVVHHFEQVRVYQGGQEKFYPYHQRLRRERVPHRQRIERPQFC